MYCRVLFLSFSSVSIPFPVKAKLKETHLLALAGNEIKLEVGHQEPSSWEYPFRTLVVLDIISQHQTKAGKDSRSIPLQAPDHSSRWNYRNLLGTANH